jgi:hypothetical protein
MCFFLRLRGPYIDKVIIENASGHDKYRNRFQDKGYRREAIQKFIYRRYQISSQSDSGNKERKEYEPFTNS